MHTGLFLLFGSLGGIKVVANVSPHHAIATYAMSTTRAALRVASRAFGGLPARAATAAAVRARAAPLVRQRRLSTETVQFTFIDSDGDTFRAPPRVFAHAPNFSRHRRAPTQR